MDVTRGYDVFIISAQSYDTAFFRCALKVLGVHVNVFLFLSLSLSFVVSSFFLSLSVSFFLSKSVKVANLCCLFFAARFNTQTINLGSYPF